MPNIKETVNDGQKSVWTSFLLLLPIVTFLLSIQVLLSWIFGIEIGRTLLPGLPAMNPTTALSFGVLSFVMYMQLNHNLERFKKTLILFVLPITVIASIRLYEVFAGLEGGVDLVLLSNKILEAENIARMSQAAATSFVLMSSTIIIFALFKSRITVVLSQLLSLATLVIASITILFYLSGSFIFFESSFFSGTSFYTALAFFILSVTWFTHLQINFLFRLIVADLRFLALLFFFLNLVWWISFVPRVMSLSNAFEYQADIFSVDNFYDAEEEVFAGEIISNTTFEYKVTDVNQGILTIESFFDVRKPTGEPIFNVTREYYVDKLTHKHVPVAGKKAREGHLFGPLNASGQDFTYWHVNYDQPVLMKYQQNQQIYGLNVQKYTSTFTADQTEDLEYLPEVGRTRGVNVDVELSIWIEPITGRLIKYEDHATAYYYSLSSGQRIEPWNTFSNVFTNPSIESQVLTAQQDLQEIFIVKTLIPSTLFLFGSIFLGVYFVQKYTNIPSSVYLPIIVFVLIASLTLVVWRSTMYLVQAQLGNQFENEADTIRNAVLRDLQIYDQTLKGVKALFEASETVTRQEFETYIKSLNIQRYYPGIQGIGYSVFIDPEELEDHIAEVRSEGFSEYSVYPQGERDIYTSTLFLEPFDFRNQRAFGYDMFSNPVRRQAMKEARDTGKTVVSGKITLVQETDVDIQPGFLMYLPLYSENVENSSISQKQESIKGYVFSPFRMNNFMNESLRNFNRHIDLEIYDGSRVSQESLMYSSIDPSQEANEGDSLLSLVQTVPLYENIWTFRFSTNPEYQLTIVQRLSSTFVLIGGFIMAIIASLSTYLLSSSQQRAVKLAKKITSDLQQKSQQLDQLNKNLHEQINVGKKTQENLLRKTEELERMNNIMVNRELKMIELKKKLDEKPQ